MTHHRVVAEAERLAHKNVGLAAKGCDTHADRADNCSVDPNRDTAFPSDIVPVRRFMALLRRELARVGVGLAFAPNGPALERRAVRAVESVLENLLRRGALVGPDARSSFQVTARAGEPAAGADHRVEVEIRVRPALPLRLLTLRLVRTGEDAFTIAEGQG